MPSETLHEQMAGFESLLDEGIESQEICLLMTSVTGGGEKIWHYYTFDSDLFMEQLNKIMDGKEVLPLEIEIYEDEDWNAYKELVGSIKE